MLYLHITKSWKWDDSHVSGELLLTRIKFWTFIRHGTWFEIIQWTTKKLKVYTFKKRKEKDVCFFDFLNYSQGRALKIDEREKDNRYHMQKPEVDKLFIPSGSSRARYFIISIMGSEEMEKKRLEPTQLFPLLVSSSLLHSLTQKTLPLSIRDISLPTKKYRIWAETA